MIQILLLATSLFQAVLPVEQEPLDWATYHEGVVVTAKDLTIRQRMAITCERFEELHEIWTQIQIVAADELVASEFEGYKQYRISIIDSISMGKSYSCALAAELEYDKDNQ